jgi:hypothetical protein
MKSKTAVVVIDYPCPNPSTARSDLMGVLSVDGISYFQCGSCLDLIVLCTMYFRR